MWLDNCHRKCLSFYGKGQEFQQFAFVFIQNVNEGWQWQVIDSKSIWIDHWPLGSVLFRNFELSIEKLFHFICILLWVYLSHSHSVSSELRLFIAALIFENERKRITRNSPLSRPSRLVRRNVSVVGFRHENEYPLILIYFVGHWEDKHLLPSRNRVCLVALMFVVCRSLACIYS